jgi:hypothetical protein
MDRQSEFETLENARGPVHNSVPSPNVSPSLMPRSLAPQAYFMGASDNYSAPAATTGASAAERSPFASMSFTTGPATAATDSTMLNGYLMSSPGYSPAILNTDGSRMVRPGSSNQAGGDSSIPFITMSPKVNTSSPAPTNTTPVAAADNSGSVAVGSSKRIAASSTLSLLKKTAAPGPSPAPRPPQASFPAGHQLPNFQPSGGTGSPYGAGSPYGMGHRSPADAGGKSLTSPILTEHDIILDQNGQPTIGGSNNRVGDYYSMRDTREPGKYSYNRPPASPASSTIIGSEYDGYRQSPQVNMVRK